MSQEESPSKVKKFEIQKNNLPKEASVVRQQNHQETIQAYGGNDGAKPKKCYPFIKIRTENSEASNIDIKKVEKSEPNQTMHTTVR